MFFRRHSTNDVDDPWNDSKLSLVKCTGDLFTKMDVLFYSCLPFDMFFLNISYLLEAEWTSLELSTIN